MVTKTTTTTSLGRRRTAPSGTSPKIVGTRWCGDGVGPSTGSCTSAPVVMAGHRTPLPGVSLGAGFGVTLCHFLLCRFLPYDVVPAAGGAVRRPSLTPPRIVWRTRVLRSPLAYWAMVVALALFTGMVVARSVRTTGSLAAHYGPLRPVAVATHRLDPGAEVGPGDIVVRQVPGSLAPAGSMASADTAVGRTVVVPLFAGLPVMEGHLAASGLKGVAALLPPGTRAVAVPNGGAPLPLVAGDHIDVLATFDPSSGSSPVGS